MTDLETATHDEFLAECQRRLDRGDFGCQGLMSTTQLDYQAMWTELYQWVRHVDEWPTGRWKMEEIIDRKPAVHIVVKAVHHQGNDPNA